MVLKKLEEIINSNKLLSYVWTFVAGAASISLAYEVIEKGNWEAVAYGGLLVPLSIVLAYENYKNSQNTLKMPKIE